MDHFAIQAAEQPGRSRAETEREFFEAYARTFQGFPTTMLVDTYDTERGIRNAVLACPNDTLGAIRIDSNVNPTSIRRARALLAELGSPSTKIYVSDGLDEHRIAELRELVDGFGVGENIVCSPDAPVGVGAVAKLVVNGYGATTMKVAHGTGKATLPGELQVWRSGDHDLVALASEPSPGGGARAVLAPVWRGEAPVAERPAAAHLAEAREHARRELEALPAAQRALDPSAARTLVASDALVREIERLVGEAR
jgi:nicotinate phosphoribosyltransferase